MLIRATNFLAICILAMCSTCVRAVWEHPSATETRLLNDGNRIPSIALGTFVVELSDRKYVTQAVIWAIEAGYRHIDTAALYITEDRIAEAIINVTCRGIVTREELFITTKLTATLVSRDQVVPAVKAALKRLQLDYVDLFLIHSAANVLELRDRDYVEIWKGLEDAKKLGLTKSIGVSNFNSTDINRLLANTKTVPAVNQIEVNPTYANQEMVAYCQSIGIVVMGYAPFGFMVPRSFNNLTFPPAFDDPKLLRIAKKYGVKTSQVVLRYQVDRDVIPIPKSITKKHIDSNIDIFDFSLTEKEVIAINEFDTNIKVYLIDDEGLAAVTGELYKTAREYVLRNHLRMYYNVLF